MTMHGDAMTDCDDIERLQGAILEYTRRQRRYAEMMLEEQECHDLANALYLRLEQLRRCLAEPKAPECAEPHRSAGDMTTLFRSLLALAESGILEAVLDPENQRLLHETLSGIKNVGFAEARLRSGGSEA